MNKNTTITKHEATILSQSWCPRSRENLSINAVVKSFLLNRRGYLVYPFGNYTGLLDVEEITLSI